MAALQVQPPPYESFDCRSEAKNVRWARWLRRLETNVFAGCGIVQPGQKKGLLLMYGGSDLNDLVDSFDDDVLEPIAAVDAHDGHPAIMGEDVYQRLIGFPLWHVHLLRVICYGYVCVHWYQIHQLFICIKI